MDAWKYENYFEIYIIIYENCFINYPKIETLNTFFQRNEKYRKYNNLYSTPDNPYNNSGEEIVVAIHVSTIKFGRSIYLKHYFNFHYSLV
jgi:hypothetical protein